MTTSCQEKYPDINALRDRAKRIEDWLKQNAPECFTAQLHLNEGSSERTYWNYGYAVAVRDALRFLTGEV